MCVRLAVSRIVELTHSNGLGLLRIREVEKYLTIQSSSTMRLQNPHLTLLVGSRIPCGMKRGCYWNVVNEGNDECGSVAAIYDGEMSRSLDAMKRYPMYSCICKDLLFRIRWLIRILGNTRGRLKGWCDNTEESSESSAVQKRLSVHPLSCSCRWKGCDSSIWDWTQRMPLNVRILLYPGIDCESIAFGKTNAVGSWPWRLCPQRWLPRERKCRLCFLKIHIKGLGNRREVGK